MHTIFFKNQKNRFCRNTKQVRHKNLEGPQTKLFLVVEIFHNFVGRNILVVLILKWIEGGKKNKMCDEGLKREDVLHEEEWPKRYSHSAGPNGGQPVSGHLLFALLPLLYFVCLFVTLVSFFLSLSLSLVWSGKSIGNCARLVFLSSCHVQMGTSQQMRHQIKR
jgi:hypothetical protein